MPSEEAIAVAAQCWCDPRTETREMDVELATVFAERVDAWIETARQFSRNEDYYRGLLDKIGEQFGPPAYTSDDGSLQDAVLRAKVPELVAALREQGCVACRWDNHCPIQRAATDPIGFGCREWKRREP